MPQMFPLLWLNLFILTLLAIFILMSVIHTMKSETMQKFSFSPNFSSKTWKW